MPTADDMIAIQSIQGLAKSLRGAGENVAAGQIGAAGIRENRQQEAAKRSFQASQLQGQLLAAQDAAEKDRKFRGEQGDKNRASKEKIGGDVTNVNVNNLMAQDDKNIIKDFSASGLFETEENPDGSLRVIGIKNTPESQAKVLRRSIINVDAMSSDDFSDPTRVDNYNKSLKVSVVEALKQPGMDPNSDVIRLLKSMQIPKDVTKAQYDTKLRSLWQGIIKKKAAEVFKNTPNAGKTFHTPSFSGGPVAGPIVERQGISEAQILSNVLEEFGGALPTASAE